MLPLRNIRPRGRQAVASSFVPLRVAENSKFRMLRQAPSQGNEAEERWTSSKKEMALYFAHHCVLAPARVEQSSSLPKQVYGMVQCVSYRPSRPPNAGLAAG
jgi:hypothetical protein